jgi:hypothetical protein
VKLAILAGVTILVLATLATSFPIIVAAQNRVMERFSSDERSSNIADHMTFTRELAEQGTKLELLAQQHQALMGVSEKVARIEERLDNVIRMVYAILGGVAGLLFKELWGAILATRNRVKVG